MFFSKAVSNFLTAILLFLPVMLFPLVIASEAAEPNHPSVLKQGFRDALRKSLEQPHTGITIPGLNGWLFFDKEFRHLLAPQFWMEPPASATDSADPLPAILDFQAQLDEAGIDLIVVPVPPKAAIYPDQILTEFPPAAPVDLSEQDSAFVKVLEAHGVKVLDLTGDFLKARSEGLDSFCRTDTHWSPEGIRLAAQKIASAISPSSWLQDFPRLATKTQNSTLQIRGDLASAETPLETLPARIVTDSDVPHSIGITDSRHSPIVLLGDSHNLVFHIGGEMHASGAGLPDQLGQELGFPMDVVAVMGSGSTAARRSLARRKDNLAGKKLVIWCFSSREFTQGQGWAKIPVIKPGIPSPTP